MSGEDLELPDFRNVGVVLRILVIAEFASLLALVAYAEDGLWAVLRPAESGVMFEATLLAIALALFATAAWLRRLPYRRGVAVVVVVAIGIAVAMDVAARALVGGDLTAGVLKAACLSGVLAGAILGYFNWRQRALSPALARARLAALQARIRPHFLFNSLNTAVALLRQDPQTAERVLLDLADLFRALLGETRALVSLRDEVRLARSYLAIEQLRLGERLRVDWRDEGATASAGELQVPLLLLQPLLENAVRFGVEPFDGGGDVRVVIVAEEGRLAIEVRNSLPGPERMPPQGNRMALANIKERLALQFDAAASLHCGVADGQYVVKLSMPAARA